MQMSEGRKYLDIVSCCFLFVIIAAPASNVYGQPDSTWIEATGKCFSTQVTPQEGWKRAAQDAETNAIRLALGITVAGQTFQVTSETMSGKNSVDYLSTFSELNTTTTSGRVIAEQIIDSSLTKEGNFPAYRVRIRAMVARDEGEPDPGFQIEVHPDKEVYYDRGDIDRNDSVHFSISSSQDCYLYVFDIMANDTVMLLMPNVYFKNNFFSAEAGEKGFDKKLGPVSLKVGLPLHKDLTTEMIYVVGLKKKIDFTSSSLSAESPGFCLHIRLRCWICRSG